MPSFTLHSLPKAAPKSSKPAPVRTYGGFQKRPQKVVPPSKLSTDSVTSADLDAMGRDECIPLVPIRFMCVARHDFKAFAANMARFNKLDKQSKKLVIALSCDKPLAPSPSVDNRPSKAFQFSEDQLKVAVAQQKTSINNELEDIRIQRLFTPRSQPEALPFILKAQRDTQPFVPEPQSGDTDVKKEAGGFYIVMKRAKTDFFNAIASAFTCCI